MAKEYKVGDRYYLPVEITDTDCDKEFPVQFKYFDGEDHYTECVAYKEGVLLTAEEIADDIDLIARSTFEGYSEKAQVKIKELEAVCEKHKHSNAALRVVINTLTTSNDRYSHKEALMETVVMVLSEKIKELESKLDEEKAKNNG